MWYSSWALKEAALPLFVSVAFLVVTEDGRNTKAGSLMGSYLWVSHRGFSRELQMVSEVGNPVLTLALESLIQMECVLQCLIDGLSFPSRHHVCLEYCQDSPSQVSSTRSTQHTGNSHTFVMTNSKHADSFFTSPISALPSLVLSSLFTENKGWLTSLWAEQTSSKPENQMMVSPSSKRLKFVGLIFLVLSSFRFGN